MAISGPAEEEVDLTVTRDPLIGAMLGEYRVLSRLGEGAMGVVYRGEQQLLGKAVAIKVLKLDQSDPSNVKRLLDEARAVTAAHHPNNIDIFSFGEAPTGQQYFVMECLEGEPLDVWLRDRGKPDLEEIAQILQQVVAGLGAAHAAGVVHRDLKPGNIFYARLSDGSRFVKILDFGLAKRGAPNSGIRTTSIVGTPLYMAPEQANGQDMGPWTDLYALGCIAYELLSGQPPFIGAGIIETIELHAKKAPASLTQRDPLIPADFEALVFELLQKEPAQRPKSAAVVRRAIDRIVRQLSIARTRGTGVRALARATNAGPVTGLEPLRAGPVPQQGQAIGPTTEVAHRRFTWKLAVLPAVLVVVAVVSYALRPVAPVTPSKAEGPVAALEAARPPSPEAPAAPPPTTATTPPPDTPTASKSTASKSTPPRPKTVRPRPVADLDKRIAQLRTRARRLDDAAAARIANQQLDEIWADLKGGTAPEKIAVELSDLEDRFFPR